MKTLLLKCSGTEIKTIRNLYGMHSVTQPEGVNVI